MGVLMGVLSSGNEESKLCVGQRRKQRGGNRRRGGLKTAGDDDLRVFLVVEI